MTDEISAISKPYGSAILKDDYISNGIPVVRGINLALGRQPAVRLAVTSLGGAKEVIPRGGNSIFLDVWGPVLRLGVTQTVTMLCE